MEIRSDSTVAEAREFVGQQLNDGVECPVCRQHAEAYKRQLRRPMIDAIGRMLLAARELARPKVEGYAFTPTDVLDRAATSEWVHLADIPQESRDTATAAYFGLIAQHPDHRGQWRVTTRGVDFLRRRGDAAAHVWVYNGGLRGTSEDRVALDDVAPGFRLDALKEDDDAV